MVIISPYVVHRHRLLWRDPDLFNPARFLGEAARTIRRYTYLPFSVGPRMCLGAALAVQEATVVAATLVREFAFELVPDQVVWPVIDFTMRPRHGLRMRIAPRLPRRSCAQYKGDGVPERLQP